MPTSVEYGIKKIFLELRFLQRVIYVTDLSYFYSHFLEFLPKILLILLKFGKIFKNRVVDSIFKDKKFLLNVFIQFLAIILAK